MYYIFDIFYFYLLKYTYSYEEKVRLKWFSLFG